MHKLSLLPALAAALMGFVAIASAQTYPVEFSAHMFQTMPDSNQASRNIYVGKDVIRIEMGDAEQRRIMIMNTGRQVAWMLNPARKEYLEMKGPSGQTPAGGNRPPLPGEPGSPCGQGQGVACKKLGVETVNGRSTEKWEITFSRGEQSATSVVWVDRSLAMPVREELPGGFVKELRDIKIGPQPAGLFQVPKDYKRVEMPQQSEEASKS